MSAFSNGIYVLDGPIDEVALYKRVLTPDERTWLYNSGQARAFSDVLPPPSANAMTYTYNAQALCYNAYTENITWRSIPHAVSAAGNNTYTYDCNGNQITRTLNGWAFTLSYDAENRLTSVTGPGQTASFVYDGDGRQVKSVIYGVTTVFVSAHYQVENGVVSKYYFAGAQRIAVRKNGTLYYLLSDHLGSTSITTNSSGAFVSELRYKPWGETRYSSGATPTAYKYTGQREESSFGLYFYQSRWYDSALGRFAQADTIIPPECRDWIGMCMSTTRLSITQIPVGMYVLIRMIQRRVAMGAEVIHPM